jgi:hypothetical protein
MKKLYLTNVITLFLLICSDAIVAQSRDTNLDQLKLMQQYVGTWKQIPDKDTSEVFEIQQFGKAFINHGYRVIKGTKSFFYLEDYGYSSKEDKFKGFILWPDGNYYTWLGSFTSDKKLSGEFVQDFDPGKVIGKFEIVLETPTSMTITQVNTSGIKKPEYKYSKVK